MRGLLYVVWCMLHEHMPVACCKALRAERQRYSWLPKTWLLVYASLTETGITGWVDNDRGVSFMFGADVVASPPLHYNVHLAGIDIDIDIDMDMDMDMDIDMDMDM